MSEYYDSWCLLSLSLDDTMRLNASNSKLTINYWRQAAPTTKRCAYLFLPLFYQSWKNNAASSWYIRTQAVNQRTRTLKYQSWRNMLWSTRTRSIGWESIVEPTLQPLGSGIRKGEEWARWTGTRRNYRRSVTRYPSCSFFPFPIWHGGIP